MIHVVLPFHLRNLRAFWQRSGAGSGRHRSRFVPCLKRWRRGSGAARTIRDHDTLKRRPFVRFFACKEDLSLEPGDTALPEAVVSGWSRFSSSARWRGG